jgi:hypothetical protein
MEVLPSLTNTRDTAPLTIIMDRWAYEERNIGDYLWMYQTGFKTRFPTVYTRKPLPHGGWLPMNLENMLTGVGWTSDDIWIEHFGADPYNFQLPYLRVHIPAKNRSKKKASKSLVAVGSAH